MRFCNTILSIRNHHKLYLLTSDYFHFPLSFALSAPPPSLCLSSRSGLASVAWSLYLRTAVPCRTRCWSTSRPSGYCSSFATPIASWTAMTETTPRDSASNASYRSRTLPSLHAAQVQTLNLELFYYYYLFFGLDWWILSVALSGICTKTGTWNVGEDL